MLPTAMMSWSSSSGKTFLYTYDAGGNLLSRGSTRTYRWTRGRRLAAVVKDGTESCYQYDHAGMRVKKTVGTAETEYRYAGRLLLSEKTGSRLQCYHYDASAELIAMSVNGTVYLYVKNLQGDIIGLTDTSGNLVVEYHYDAWGNPAGVTGSKASTVGVQNPFRYRGYYYDNETGMYYVSSRYYDPEIGRFINTDDIDYLGEDGSSLSYNLFAYCMNNPVNRFDINGNWSLPNLAKIAIGAAAIAVGVIATAATGGAAAPVLVASLKIAATSAAIGAVSGAGISAVNHRVSTGSWEGTGKAAVTGAIDGACDGFMWGGITAGATTVALAAKGTYINKIGNLKPTGKSENGYTGVRYSVKKSSGKLSYKSIELHSPHTGGKHNFWHWQKNQWSYYNKIWSISDKKAKVFTLLGKRVP